MMPDDAYSTLDLTKTEPNDIFMGAHHRIFAIVLWYSLFGLVGAALYYFAKCLHDSETHPKKDLYYLVDWVPVRFTALLYIIVGQFSEGFNIWMNNVKTGLQDSKHIIIECGHAAIVGDHHTLVVSTEDAVAISKRAIVALLVIVAIFTIGSWMA